MRRAARLAAIGAAAWPSIALAQTPADPAPAPAAEKPEATGAILIPGAGGRADTLIPSISFDLTVDGEKSESTVKLGGLLMDRARGGTGDTPSVTWGLKGSFPVGGGDDVTSSKVLDSLGDGPSITLSLGALWFGSSAENLDGDGFTALMDKARAVCRERATGAKDLESCATEGRFASPQFARQYVNPYAVNRALFDGFWRFDVEGTIGWNDYKYYDAGTLAEHKDSKTKYSAAAVLAYYPSDAMTAVTGKVEYQDGYEAKDETIVCKTVVADPATDCVKGAPGAPDAIERLNLSLSVARVMVVDPKLGFIAIAPKATFDALNSEWGAEFPVYFVPKDSPVAPAIVVSYSSEDDFDVAFKLKASFSF